MYTKLEQHIQEINELRKEIDKMKESMKPLQQRKTYLQRQVSMLKSREKNKKMK